MNKTCESVQKFTVDQWISIPDGTEVAPFLNSTDCTSPLPWGFVEGFSLAAGRIEHESRIHTMPAVTQVVFLLEGELCVRIKQPTTDEVENISLLPQEAALMQPESFFQFLNKGRGPCKVLYIVSPSYVYELSDLEKVIYDDSIIIEAGWEELRKNDWSYPGQVALETLMEQRRQSIKRLEKRKIQGNSMKI